MKLGNIVTTSEISVPIEFNVVKSMDEIIENIPTLICSFAYVNKHYPTFNIFDKEIAPNLYWTFKKTEKRDKFNEDIDWFIRKTYSDLTNKLTYIFIDPIQLSSKTLIKIIRKIYETDAKIAYFDDVMVYIYTDNLIFGIDMELIEFVGLNKKRLVDKINKNCFTLTNTDESIVECKKDILLLNNKPMFIPFLYSLRNNAVVSLS